MKKMLEILFVFLIGCIGSVFMNDCSANIMAKCTDPLRVVTDNKDLGFATSYQELEQMCPKLMDGLRCIDTFTQKCLEREHRAYFNTLYTGTTQVISDLCNQGQYQTEYLQHAPCMRKAQAEYESCAQEYQLKIKALNKPEKSGAKGTDEDNVQILCCSFQEYLHCSEAVVNTTCGASTASFTKGFLDRMSGPLVQGHCQEYSVGSNMCPTQSAVFSVDSSSLPLSSLPPLLLLPLLIFFSL
ncbi:uncharacterized protein LOC111713548 [Eurytemora carolleeae]|uniref:uncharacterized protein LOC111713548 n=1 Tax=Eurytemora carolleeae TaxID=1294199 RepID=UPI000C765940|nr:uncharacterized protein LOC111713548 [Eurytemora carolleeae]XP_023344196.1 uncharacterized protein LOC111713548 [Eurytemora carolleeae]XP_023344197.1 uncharacterized protein LOC111713548 [Eurytemora carolleeae]|eukprot:XP_023344195.1 uncharacterized protein LOC111713548 [Eurytemora affinis]